jgi:spermidine/putrescine transport system permease protein
MGRGHLWRFPGLRASAWFFFAFLYLPILVLLAYSFNASQQATIWTGFSFRWYGVVLGNDDIMRAFRNSLVVATTATLLATTVATLAALGMARGRFPGQDLVSGLIGLPLVVPEIVTAVATLLFFVLLGFRLGLLTVIVAHTVFCIPFAYLPIRARLEGMDPLLREAAADLYAGPWQTFRRVTLPAIRWALAYGMVLSLARSLGEYGAVAVVSGRIKDQTQTLTLFVEERFQNFDQQAAYAAAFAMAVVAVATLLLITLLRPREDDR